MALKRVKVAGDDIFLIENLLSATECQAWIQETEAIGYAKAPVSTAFGPQFMPNLRNNSRVMIDDPERAEQIWQAIKDLVPEVEGHKTCGLNERLRFYRYDPGESFELHSDGCYQRANGERSRLTFMIYLNEGFEGGQTRFVNHSVVPATGTALFFKHALLHEGEELSAGRKYVLRSDVMCAPMIPETAFETSSEQSEDKHDNDAEEQRKKEARRWFGLRSNFVLTDDGIDWKRRRYHKRWSLKRLGKHGALELLEQMMPLKSRCYHKLATGGLGDYGALKPAFEKAVADREHIHWLMDLAGGWLIEINKSQTLTVERFPKHSGPRKL